MIWHIVRFELGTYDDEVRRGFERQLEDLVGLDGVAFLRVGRDVNDPAITGLVVGLADAAALTAYREHPDHQPVLDRIRELDIPRVALDIESDDDPGSLA
ncbi:MAG: Dabb family protein [Nitriliruptor sp.]